MPEISAVNQHEDDYEYPLKNWATYDYFKREQWYYINGYNLKHYTKEFIYGESEADVSDVTPLPDYSQYVNY